MILQLEMQGVLTDGTAIAVKQLSSKSKQGNREFVNEIGMISALQHPHLVKLYGCCIEGNQLLLVYEYMENNSLAHALFGKYLCHMINYCLFLLNLPIWLGYRDLINGKCLKVKKEVN